MVLQLSQWSFPWKASHPGCQMLLSSAHVIMPALRPWPSVLVRIARSPSRSAPDVVGSRVQLHWLCCYALKDAFSAPTTC